MADHINVFISYSWDSQEHKDWVKKFASDLMGHGVNVVLDQWDVRLGDDLPFFMEQGLCKSHLVICICSENYVKKANSARGGVGYEKRILTADMISDSSRRYIIPVIRNNSGREKLPTFLSGLLYEDFDSEDYFLHYFSLLKRVYDEDIKDKPAIGENPFVSMTVSDAVSTKLAIEAINYCNIQLSGKVRFDYKRNNGRFKIGSGQNEFITSWSECGEDSVYCYRDNVLRIGYNGDSKEFPTIAEIPVLFDFSSRVWRLRIGHVILLENNHHRFAAIKVLSIQKFHEDIEHYLEFEYKIYVPEVGA